MDNDNEAEDSMSTAELENMRLALQIALEQEESDDEYSDDSEEEDKSRKDSDESSSDEDMSSGGEDDSTDNYEGKEEACPVKRSKLDDTQPHENNSERPVESEISDDRSSSNKCQAASKTRMKRVPEFDPDPLALPLPDGWCQTLHDSGVPIYMHHETRVVTLSRPYHLKTDSLRRHSIPLGSIPCQEQRILRERSCKSGMASRGSNNELQVPQVQIRTKEERIAPDDLYEMAKERFSMKQIMVVIGYGKGKWRAMKEKKEKEMEEQAIEDESFIHFDAEIVPFHTPSGRNTIRKKGRVLNIIGKGSVELLHQYSQKVLRGMIQFKIEHLNSKLNPYSAMVFLKKEGEENGNLLGRASAFTKKNAKRNAASEALRSLIPGIKIDENHIVQGNVSEEKYMEVFDMLAIDDKKVSDYSNKTGRSSPYLILLACIRLNSAWGVTEPEQTFEQKDGQNRQVMLKVGKYETRVQCKTRREGRDMAAQILLKEMHPMLDSWGAVFRLYSTSVSVEETIQVRSKVCKMQHEIDEVHKRNYTRNNSVLEALRKEIKRVSCCMEVKVERERGLMTTRPAVYENDIKMERKEGNKSILSTCEYPTTPRSR